MDATYQCRLMYFCMYGVGAPPKYRKNGRNGAVEDQLFSGKYLESLSSMNWNLYLLGKVDQTDSATL